jgi:hypothetical protein
VQLQEVLSALKERQGKGSAIRISKRLEKKPGKNKKKSCGNEGGGGRGV